MEVYFFKCMVRAGMHNIIMFIQEENDRVHVQICFVNLIQCSDCILLARITFNCKKSVIRRRVDVSSVNGDRHYKRSDRWKRLCWRWSRHSTRPSSTAPRGTSSASYARCTSSINSARKLTVSDSNSDAPLFVREPLTVRFYHDMAAHVCFAAVSRLLVCIKCR